jgi:hypothetical protein
MPGAGKRVMQRLPEVGRVWAPPVRPFAGAS